MSSDSAALVPDRLRERLTAPILRTGLRIALKPMLSPRVPIAWQRRWLETLAWWMRGRSAAKVEPTTLAGVRGEWVRATDTTGAGACTILYLHGGGYCIGSPATHRALTTALANATGLPVFAADYRLAPEHPFPAALEDRWRSIGALAASGPVVIAGDSAGAGLSLATALSLRGRRHQTAGCAGAVLAVDRSRRIVGARKPCCERPCSQRVDGSRSQPGITWPAATQPHR